MSRWWMHDAFMLTLLRGFYYGDLNVFVLLCNTWQKTAILGLWVWDGVVCVCVCHAKLEIFLRFSSRAPGKCLITSGFVLSAMIILFYAVLFSYSGLGMKALIFHWSTHWGTFCVYIWIHSYFFLSASAYRDKIQHLCNCFFNPTAAFSVQVSETGGVKGPRCSTSAHKLNKHQD